jgi:type II secretory pathway predicted ATPase ExeA
MNHKLLALYGLKFNPFTPELPAEALHVSPRLESFCWRIENALLREGGFALIHGEPGSGKSVALRVIAQRLARLPDVQLGTISHPQCNLADFYRELGDVFGVPLRPHNRWGGFKALRERWLGHLESCRRRPVLLIDEAQEMNVVVLSELRLMASAQFDSQPLLCVVLAGDARLPDKLRREELIPLGSRIRMRLPTEAATPEELRTCLDFVLAACGNAELMTKTLKHTLCDHAAGNYRVLATLAAERERPATPPTPLTRQARRWCPPGFGGHLCIPKLSVARGEYTAQRLNRRFWPNADGRGRPCRRWRWPMGSTRTLCASGCRVAACSAPGSMSTTAK